MNVPDAINARSLKRAVLRRAGEGEDELRREGGGATRYFSIRQITEVGWLGTDEGVFFHPFLAINLVAGN